MDPDILRLILVLLGVALVAGIYLWDRYKRAVRPRRAHRRAPTVDRLDDLDSETNTQEGPSRTDDHDPPDADMATRLPAVEVPVEDHPQRTRSALDPEPIDLGDWGAPVATGQSQLTMDLNFDAHGDGDYLSTDPALRDEVERKLVVINIAARAGSLSGPAIEKACGSLHLVMGDMSIFHCHDGRNGQVLFSLANMVEPGVFPAGEMGDFDTPGLTLFTQLPGPRDGVAIFDQMLTVARRLAELLGAECQDDQHNKLTRQMEEHLRESIIEHRRRIRLARSRH